VNRANAALAACAGGAATILTGAAFWISYSHLHSIASTNGIGDTARSWAWPATIDLFIVVGEVLTLLAAIRRAVDWWAISLTIVGSVGSIAINVSGVGTGQPTMTYVVAAVPPVAALLAFGVIMRQLHSALTRRTPNTPAAPPVPPVNTTPEQPEHAPTPPAVPPVATRATPVPAQLITGKELALILGKSPVTIRRYVMDGKLTPAATDPVRGSLFHPDQRPAA